MPAGTWVVPADQEFAALAREVLDVQKYPEIRESPNGPLDTPYDAAGWTLPLSMGVRTIAATTPLTDEIRSKLRPLGPRWRRERAADAVQHVRVGRRGGVRQRAGHRLRQRSGRRARSCRRPAGSPAAGRRSP